MRLPSVLFATPTPGPALLAMVFGWPGTDPPTVLLLERRVTPDPNPELVPFPSGLVPLRCVPIRLPWMTTGGPVTLVTMMPPPMLPEIRLPRTIALLRLVMPPPG